MFVLASRWQKEGYIACCDSVDTPMCCVNIAHAWGAAKDDSGHRRGIYRRSDMLLFVASLWLTDTNR